MQEVASSERHHKKGAPFDFGAIRIRGDGNEKRGRQLWPFRIDRYADDLSRH
jgi:hypothetical protein